MGGTFEMSIGILIAVIGGLMLICATIVLDYSIQEYGGVGKTPIYYIYAFFLIAVGVVICIHGREIGNKSLLTNLQAQYKEINTKILFDQKNTGHISKDTLNEMLRYNEDVKAAEMDNDL